LHGVDSGGSKKGWVRRVADVVTFTGTRWPPDGTAELIATLLWTLPSSTKLITGAAIGIDTLVAVTGLKQRFHVHAVVPATTDQADVDWLKHCTSYEVMPRGSTFRDRDTRMVDLGKRVIAFPLYPEKDPRSKRSGTWMTVRIAHKQGKQVTIYPLWSNDKGFDYGAQL
jgi:hypothetical protein